MPAEREEPASRKGLATVVRASIPKDELGKALNLRDNQLIVLAQTVGYPAGK